MRSKVTELLKYENRNKYKLPDYYYDYLKLKGYLNKDFDSLSSFFERLVSRYNLQNKNILEIGFHFGFDAIILNILGVNNYTGIEYKEKSITIANEVKNLLDIKNLNYVLGDVEKLEFPKNSFDFIFCHSVVSHIPDFLMGYNEMLRILKPGGILFFIDENNFLRNRKFRRINWVKADYGPQEVSKEVGIDKPYIDIRKDILKKEFPEIDESKIKEIAVLTYGYAKEELLISAKILIKGGKINKKKESREPITGYWAEREINPFNEIKLLRKIGFANVKLVSFYNKNKYRPMYKNIILKYIENHAWPYLLLDTHFNIEASKPIDSSIQHPRK